VEEEGELDFDVGGLAGEAEGGDESVDSPRDVGGLVGEAEGGDESLTVPLMIVEEC